jgi:hypothetical protein
MLNNWSLDLQTWCDLLNTPILQDPPTPDELADASPLHRWSNASPTPRPHTLFQPPPPQPSYPPPYHYPPYAYPPPPVSGSSGGNAPPSYPYPDLHHMDTHHIHILHLWSVVHQVVVLLHRIRILLPQSVVCQVVLLLNHIHTFHLRHIHTLHLNLFTPEVVKSRVEGTTPPIQLKLHQG